MKMRLGLLAGASAVVALALILASTFEAEAAFGSGSAQPQIGKQCTVQFRRGDVLGAAANLPISPTTGSINGAPTSLSGTLRTVTEEWVVIESEQSVMWIPKASILLLQFPSK